KVAAVLPASGAGRAAGAGTASASGLVGGVACAGAGIVVGRGGCPLTARILDAGRGETRGVGAGTDEPLGEATGAGRCAAVVVVVHWSPSPEPLPSDVPPAEPPSPE